MGELPPGAQSPYDHLFDLFGGAESLANLRCSQQLFYWLIKRSAGSRAHGCSCGGFWVAAKKDPPPGGLFSRSCFRHRHRMEISTSKKGGWGGGGLVGHWSLWEEGPVKSLSHLTSPRCVCWKEYRGRERGKRERKRVGERENKKKIQRWQRELRALHQERVLYKVQAITCTHWLICLRELLRTWVSSCWRRMSSLTLTSVSSLGSPPLTFSSRRSTEESSPSTVAKLGPRICTTGSLLAGKHPSRKELVPFPLASVFSHATYLHKLYL